MSFYYGWYSSVVELSTADGRVPSSYLGVPYLVCMLLGPQTRTHSFYCACCSTANYSCCKLMTTLVMLTSRFRLNRIDRPARSS